MKKVIQILIIALTFVFASCKSFLSIDDYFSDELKLDSVFSEKRYVEAYLWAIANQFTDEGSLMLNSYTPGPLATDEAFTVMLTDGGYNGMRFVLGEVSARNLYSLNCWAPMYRAIRKCNTLLNRIDEAQDMTTVERFKIIGNAKFMRAYAYYNILLNQGPPILLYDEVIENNETLEFYDRGRCTYDEAVEYICSELEEAAQYMDASVPIAYFGRPTKGAAYGLIARLRLYHASPLFNGGDAARRVFGTWKRSSDGELYVSQIPDERRWALAAAAAKRVMDMGLYRLYTVTRATDSKPLPTNITTDPDYYKPFPEGAADIDHFKSCSELFNGEAVVATNPEFVWARNSTTLTENTRMVFPYTNGGWNGMAVTQKVIDAFRMYDGRDINNSSPEYPYSETGFTSSPQGFSDYRFTTNPVYNMYVNREMRFYANIGFNNCYWGMTSATSAVVREITYTIDGNNGRYGSRNQLDYPPTGYVIKKFINPFDAYAGEGARRVGKAYAMIRYADILLMYAEALNNLTMTHTIEVDGVAQPFYRDTEAIREAFNQVRHRAGLPGLTGDEDRATVQQLIEQERMVELLFENHRYFDVRRWGKYEESESVAITGMNTEGSGDSYYRRVVPNSSRIGARVVHKKLHLVPLPLDEVRRLPLLDQNPGWEE